MFSRRSSRDQSPNPLAALLARAGRPRFDLTSSNPTSVGLAYPAALGSVLARSHEQARVYAPEAFGSLSARRAVAALSGADAADVMLSASTSEAYAFLFKLLCDPGDTVLVPAPSYPLFEHLAELEGVQVATYRVAYDGAWHLDLDSLRRAVHARVRAVVVVSPNNPTGQYLTRAEQTALAQLCLPVICDEVFAEFPLSESAQPPPAPPEDSLWFRLDGLSKRLGSPQLKLGWTIINGPEPLRRAARSRLELIADTYLSVATAVQHALPELLQLAPEISATIRARCRDNLRQLDRALVGSTVTRLHAEAGWSAVLRLPRVQSEEQWVLGLATQAEVLLQPGWFYDFDAEPYAVISLLTPPDVLEAGMARLVEHVEKAVG